MAVIIQNIIIQTMECFREKKKVQFIPEKWQQGLGEVCFSCRSRLESQDAISLCKCYLFSHQTCFLRQFSPYITDYQQIKCIRCGEEVKMKMSYIYKWECNKTPVNIASIAFAFAILIAVMVLTITKIFDANFGWPIFAIGFVILTAATIYAQRRKYINLDKVRVESTNLLGTDPSPLSATPNQNNYTNDLKQNKNDLYSATSQNHVAAFDIQ